MRKRETETVLERETAAAQQPDGGAAKSGETAGPRKRPIGGFLIAAGSLALLFGIAALKGRVKDNTQ